MPESPALARPDEAPSRVLCVDDEPHVLTALRRALRSPDLSIASAESGAAALLQMQQQPFDLVISDMRMPGCSGTELLEQVRQHWPDTVRIVLTGQADHRDTIAAINRGSIFRYLSKPWDDEELRQVVRQGLERRALEQDRRRLQALTQQQNEALRDANAELERRVAERTAALAGAHERLKHTYVTTIRVFTNLLERRNGRLQGHGRRVGDLARRIGKALKLPDEALQDLLVAGMLHDIGLIGVPDSILLRPVARLASDEQALYQRHPLDGEQWLMAMDELQAVGALIHAHHERHDGQGFPDGLSGDAIPLGARILAVADTYDALCHGLLVDCATTPDQARLLIRRGRGTQFDPQIVDLFLSVTEPQAKPTVTEAQISTAELAPGMVLAADLISSQGLLMLTRGQRMTDTLVQRIRAFEAREGAPLRLRVRRPSGVDHAPNATA